MKSYKIWVFFSFWYRFGGSRNGDPRFATKKKQETNNTHWSLDRFLLALLLYVQYDALKVVQTQIRANNSEPIIVNKLNIVNTITMTIFYTR